MEENENWDIEEFRTKFESDEHWMLKKDFMIVHKGKFPKDRLLCLAQLFVNIKLLRCKYPDPVMKQVAELSKDIGKDYKMKQRERLQRTFVKASDAAKEKIRGEKRKLSPVQKVPPSKIATVQETSSGSCTNTGTKCTNFSGLFATINYIKETFKTTTDVPVMNAGSSSPQPNEYKLSPVQKVPPSKIETVQETSSGSFTNTGTKCTNLQTHISGLFPTINFIKETFETTTDEPEMNAGSSSPQPNEYIQSLKIEDDNERVPETTPMENEEENFEFQPEICDPSLDMDFDDPLMSNMFLVLRSFLDFVSFFEFLRSSIQFSQLKYLEDVFIEEKSDKFVWTVSVRIGRDILPLGSGKHFIEKVAREEASKEAVEKILKRCYTVEIKKRASGDEKISIDQLGGYEKRDEYLYDDNVDPKVSLPSNNVGAKMLKLMGWSGGGLGKNSDGIIQPVKASKVIGRKGLGITNERLPTPMFREKVREILDALNESLLSQPDEIIPDIVFSSELSNHQRKCIHLYCRRHYRLLKSVSYGKDRDRFLIVKPKLDTESLFHKVCSQGGLTDQYQIHKPGTLTLEDLSKKKIEIL